MTNLKIVAIVVATLLAYTAIANMIPQIQSEVPQELELSGEFNPEELVQAGEQIYNGAGGCTACHGLGTRAPNLLTGEGGTGPIGSRCADRVPGESCKDYLHNSMVEPNEFVVPGYNPIMPDMRRVLSDAQIWAVIAFLQSQGGEVTVTAEDVETAEAGGDEEEAATEAAEGEDAPPATTDPQELLQAFGCLNCHQLGDQGMPVGPPLSGIGARRDTDHIRESILRPNADTTSGYEHMAGIMPADFGARMTAAQLESLVEFLAASE